MWYKSKNKVAGSANPCARAKERMTVYVIIACTLSTCHLDLQDSQFQGLANFTNLSTVSVIFICSHICILPGSVYYEELGAPVWRPSKNFGLAVNLHPAATMMVFACRCLPLLSKTPSGVSDSALSSKRVAFPFFVRLKKASLH